jgi:hypothetical protein
MKQLQVTIIAYDSDHTPQKGAQVIPILSNTPWLTAGRIIQAIHQVIDSERCTFEHSELVEDWLG